MSNNNDNSGFAIAIALVAAGVYFLMAFVFAIAGFITIIFTILSFFAWNREVRLGSMIVTPEEARGFVGRGLLGMGLLPLFLIFCEVLFGIAINWKDFGVLILFGGYVLGSLGVGILIEQAKEEQAKQAPPIQPQVRQVQHAPDRLPAPPSEPFRFASWDDEEER